MRICAGFATALAVVIKFSWVLRSLGNRTIALDGFSRFGLFAARGGFVDYRGTRLADDLVLGIRAPGDADCANDRAIFNQWNAAARGDDSIEREQIVELHEIDTVFEDLGGAPECGGCASFVLGNLNGGEHRAVHA